MSQRERALVEAVLRLIYAHTWSAGKRRWLGSPAFQRGKHPLDGVIAALRAYGYEDAPPNVSAIAKEGSVEGAV